jgi:hypothetical protein
MPPRILLAALLLQAACATAQTDTPAVELHGSAAVLHRKLVENIPGLGRVEETGPVGQLQLGVTKRMPEDRAVQGRFTLTGADLRYAGLTQGGAPLATTTRHIEGSGDLLLRPHAPSRWGDLWLMTGVLVNRRIIQGTQAASGLDETSTAWMVGVRWDTPKVALAGLQVWAESEAQTSIYHRLHVEGLFPSAVRFEGADKRLLALRLHASAPNSPWTWSVHWSRLSQPASDSVRVTNAGGQFLVNQPELSIRDVGVRVTRRF